MRYENALTSRRIRSDAARCSRYSIFVNIRRFRAPKYIICISILSMATTTATRKRFLVAAQVFSRNIFVYFLARLRANTTNRKRQRVEKHCTCGHLFACVRMHRHASRRLFFTIQMSDGHRFGSQPTACAHTSMYTVEAAVRLCSAF